MSGKRISYLGLIAGAALSIVGNVTHTVLTRTDVSLGILVPLAVVWPAGLFIAVEILVRVSWPRTLLSFAGRAVLIGPVGAMAGIVSYIHLHHLMQMSGEVEAVAVLGPLAIDGLMMGSTVALLVIRAAEMLAARVVVMPEGATLDEAEAAASEGALVVDEDLSSWLGSAVNLGTPLPVAQVTTPAPRKPRATPAALEAAVKMLLAGDTLSDAVDQTGMGVSTLRRYVRVIGMVKGGEQVDAGKEKVRPEILDMIRLETLAAMPEVAS